MDKEPATAPSEPPASHERRRTQPENSRSGSKSVSHNPRGRGRGGHPRKERNMGRSAWASKTDKRKRNEDEQDAKRQRVDRGDAELPIYATKFQEDEIKAEERRPKKKVAVLIGYAGTGYKGMQLAHDQKTIEGDLFQAFVAAGAISKANADDPKKSSFVRCARTDKGVHAAGNVISLKLIVEDENIVQKINDNLTSQIRVWGFERTNNSFSAYQLCDSRIYEYLIPTHSFLPPHPSSFLGRKVKEIAEEKGDTEGLKSRQQEVEGYWEKVEAEVIKPILDTYDDETRRMLEKALYLKGEEGQSQPEADEEPSTITTTIDDTAEPNPASKLDPAIVEATKSLRIAYVTAKRTYRIPETRLQRIREALSLFVGTRNFHNYTISKPFRDPSAKRVIKSFNVNPTPILINGSEWLSLKVHGQSFMMHQIRKMVGMVALIVRCGRDPNLIRESYGAEKISIPKAPSLGLLLERPVFDSYNSRAKNDLGKEEITFDKYKKEMDEFKQREIYERMYRDEEKDNVFGNFFNHVDSFPASTFLFVTSGGIEATKVKIDGASNATEVEKALVQHDAEDSDDERVDANGAEG